MRYRVDVEGGHQYERVRPCHSQELRSRLRPYRRHNVRERRVYIMCGDENVEGGDKRKHVCRGDRGVLWQELRFHRGHGERRRKVQPLRLRDLLVDHRRNGMQVAHQQQLRQWAWVPRWHHQRQFRMRRLHVGEMVRCHSKQRRMCRPHEQQLRQRPRLRGWYNDRKLGLRPMHVRTMVRRQRPKRVCRPQ